MKICVFALSYLYAFVASLAVKEQDTDDSILLQMQKDTLILLKNIYQPLHYKNFVDISETYNISEHQDLYMSQEALQDFLEYNNYGHLARGQTFSVFNKEHLREAIAVFKLLYNAKDYKTFLKTAVWTREHLNEGLFLYSYLVSLIHRPDTKDIIIPPIHEINPYYFFSKETIRKAQVDKYLFKNITFYEIESTQYSDKSLSYYLEDVGVSSYYFFYQLYFPFWMKGEDYGFGNVNRGEQYYFFHQQLLARYYLERISNGLGEIPFIKWNMRTKTLFYPSLEYPNGLEFPSRPSGVDLEEAFYNNGDWTSEDPYSYLEDYERRINDAVDSGYVFNRSGKKIDLYTEEGVDILGNLIQANKDSPCHKYYGPLWIHASQFLGYSYQVSEKNKTVPSALEHFETALRDPIFYQLYKKIMLKFQRYYTRVPSYTEKDLVFDGVKVSSFSVDPLVTYYDYFYSDISNALYFTGQELEDEYISVPVRQQRLNSKTFTYKLRVQSDKATRSVIKVFLGPKYDEYGQYINLTQSRINMLLIDYFVFDLVSGENTISRNSNNSFYFGRDTISLSDLYNTVKSNGSISNQKNYFFYPRRYMLPKGSSSGTPYQFYVIVYPYKAKAAQLSKKYESYYYPYVDGQQFYDSYSLGFPFDRFIRFEKLWYDVPNSYFHEVKIYHKGVEAD